MKPNFMLLIILGGMFALACGVFSPVGMSPYGTRPFLNGNYDSNGEQIYFTAVNDKGEYISYTGGPSYGGMMNAQLACVSCHGASGRGGLHSMHMQQMIAPDIRYSALASETDEHGGGDTHAGEYDLKTFQQAVVLGQHPDGEALDGNMPHWIFSDDDLADLFEYIKTLP